MSGILVAWEGFPAYTATFRRGRGLAADLSEVVLPASVFEEGQARIAEVDLRQRKSPTVADTSGIEVDLPGELSQLVEVIPAEGTLAFAQVLGAQQLPGVTIPNLFVIRVDTDERDDVTGEVWIRLILADERIMWERGVVRRWSFNRALLDGTRARDSGGQGGQAVSKAEILRAWVSPSLFRGVEVTQVPGRWETDVSEVEFRPWEGATQALADLVRLGDTELPCLRLDGTLALHEQGDGKDKAYAEDGRGPNATALPPDVFLDEDGRGQGYSVELSYRPEFALVVGLPRVATVALDDWEPVVVVRGQPFLLSEEFVRKVTGDRFGLDWLRKFVLAPASEQARIDLPEDVLELLRSQAYRLFRLPGAELVEGGFYTGSAGPNAHLLPLLDRAETQGARRLPPAVETYRWVQRHKRLSATEADEAGIQAAKRLAELKRLVFATALRQGVEDPLSGKLDPRLSEGFEAGATAGIPETLGFRPTSAQKAKLSEFMSSAPLGTGVSWSTIATLLTLARRADSVAALDASLGGQYLQALDDKYAAEGPVKTAHWELAKELRKIEKEAAKLAQPGDPTASLDEFRARIHAAFEQAADKIAEAQAEQDRQEALGLDPEGLRSAVVHLNLPREEDAGAGIYSRDLGVVRATELAGHLADQDVPSQDMTELRPCPVRVVFGSEVRPRLDVAPPLDGTGVLTDPRPQLDPVKVLGLQPTPAPVAGLTGELGFDGQGPLVPFAASEEDAAGCSGGQNAIPTVLTDQASLYVAAFRRVGQDAQPIPLEQLPLNQARVIRRSWRELLPLEGEGNRFALDRDAQVEAARLFAGPDRVAGWSRRIDGAWPIQCDGVVSYVEIATDLGEKGVPVGFTTTVQVGTAPPEAPDPRRTITRRSPDAGLDAARRVGAGA